MRVVGSHLSGLVAPFLLAAGLSAQASGTATLEGVILDEQSATPVAGVLLRLDTGQEVLSDESGRFRIADVVAGHHLYAVLTADCKVTWGEVDLTANQVLATSISVESALESGEAQEEESRRTRSKGKLVTASEIDAMHAATMAEVIRRVAPTMVMGNSEEAGAVTQLTSRGSNSIVSKSVPIVVVDGMRVDDGARVLDQINPATVETLEILPGAAGGWEYGSSGSGGVIKVTTGRSGPAARNTQKKCVVPDFPGR